MRATAVRPTGVERQFGETELIVTKTDTKGVITYANDVFLRLSAYPEDQVVGQPHNIIRHPDMPRCVFKLLWDTLRAGEEMFAYIVNLAGDGAHYWVFAHVTPSRDAHDRIVGYHSNRRLPDRPAVAAVTSIYAELSAAERAHGRPADAVEASSALLTEKLGGRTYDRWVWSLTGEEAQ
jgi:PAS domain S-box-containing protein